MVRISQSTLDEVGRVSAAVARQEAGPERKFTLTLDLNTEAFGGDAWDREMEVARILRQVSMSLYGGAIVGQEAELRDRHGRTVGKYEFSED